MSRDSLLINAYNPFLLLEFQAFKIPTKRSGELEAVYEHETLLKKKRTSENGPLILCQKNDHHIHF